MRIAYICILLLFCFLSVGYAEEINDDLINAIIQVESGGNPNAYNSRSGAIGLMQITSCVLREWNNLTMVERGASYVGQKEYENYKLSDLWNIDKNIFLGTWYLKRLKDHYLKDRYTIERLLAAYNGGYGKLRKVNFDVNKMPKETRDYVKKVMRLYKERQ